jgi:hypothetical protein
MDGAVFTQSLAVVARFAWPASAGFDWTALQAATVARRCDRPPGWSHLGCDHAGPSLRGPWMAPQA